LIYFLAVTLSHSKFQLDERRISMKVLTKEVVVLQKLAISFDADYRTNKLVISSEPSIVYGTGREVTQEQLNGISKVLYGHVAVPFKKGFSYELNTNLLSAPTYCTLVLSDHMLVAIGNQVSHTYYYLPTGAVMTEEELFETCKSAKLESLSYKRTFLERKLKETIKQYEELEKMTF